MDVVMWCNLWNTSLYDITIVFCHNATWTLMNATMFDGRRNVTKNLNIMDIAMWHKAIMGCGNTMWTSMNISLWHNHSLLLHCNMIFNECCNVTSPFFDVALYPKLGCMSQSDINPYWISQCNVNFDERRNMTKTFLYVTFRHIHWWTLMDIALWHNHCCMLYFFVTSNLYYN